MVYGYGYKELKDDSQTSDAKKTVGTCKCGLFYAVELLRANREAKANILRAYETSCDLPAEGDYPTWHARDMKLGCMKKNYISTKSYVLVYGAAYAWLITCIISCYIIVSCSGARSMLLERDSDLIKVHAGIIANALLGDTTKQALIWLSIVTSPDLAPDSSEEGDSPMVHTYGVNYKPAIFIFGSVETPIQHPEDILPTFSERLEQFISAPRASNPYNAWISSTRSNTFTSVFEHVVFVQCDVFTYQDDDDEDDLVINVPIMGAMRVYGTASLGRAATPINDVKHVVGLGWKEPLVTGKTMKRQNRHGLDLFGLKPIARPHLALDSSEEGDSATVDPYGVISQAKQYVPTCSFVETPIQEPEARPLSSRAGPDDDDIDSTSTTAINAPWLLASSAPCHMAGDASQMVDYVPMHDGNDDIFAGVPNMGTMRVHGTGSVRTATMCLDNVKHVPGLGKRNLVSTGLLARGGYTVTLAPSGCSVTKGDHTVVGEAHFTNDNLLQIDFLRVPSSSSD